MAGKMKSAIVVVLWLALFVLLPAPLNAQVTLVRDGGAEAVVVTAEKPSKAVIYAKNLLLGTIEQMAGAKLEVHTVTDANLVALKASLAGRQVICVGNSAWTRELGIATDDWQTDEFLLRTLPGVLVVAGQDDARFEMKYGWVPASGGTLYGMHRLLETLGVRWFYPGEQSMDVPSKTTVVVDEMDVRDRPYFPYRFTGRGDAWHRWAGFGGDGDVWATRHTFEQTYDWNKLFRDTHPEYFSRGQQGGRIGFAHDGVVEQIVEQAKDYFESSRPAGKRKYFIVGGNDHLIEVCHCDKCQPWVTRDRPEQGWYSDYIGQAVVQVAEALKDEYPDNYIVYLAYERYTLPPERIKKLPSNVIVLLAQSRLRTVEQAGRQQFIDLVRQWQALEPAGIAFCRYYTFGTNIVPVFVPRLIASDIRLMKELNETGKTPIIGELQFTKMSPDSDWWFRLNQYITARCLWNPDLDIDALLEDFYTVHFGPASSQMKQVFEAVQEAYMQEPGRALYPAAFVDRIEGYLNDAEAAADGTVYQTRVLQLREKIGPLFAMRQKTAEATERSHVPAKARVMDYPLDQLGKAGAANRANPAQHGRPHAVRLASHRGARCLYFNGQSSFVRIPHVSLPSDAYTISMWISPSENLARRKVYEKIYLVGPEMYDRAGLYIQNQRLTLIHRDASGEKITVAGPPFEFISSQWHHVAGTFSAEHGMSLYIDGKLVAYDASKTTPPSKGYGWLACIGGSGVRGKTSAATELFPGWIRDVRLYNEELSLHDMRQLP